MAEDERVWHTWVQDNVGQLIAAAPGLTTSPPASRVAAALARCIDLSANGNLMEFARRLQVPKHFVSAWRSGDVMPQLGALLRICYVARTPLLRFLTEPDLTDARQETQPQTSRPIWFPPRSRRQRFDAVQVRRAMLHAIGNADHPPFDEVARRIGHDPQTLRTHFPDLCRAVHSQHAAHVRAKWAQVNRRLRRATREAVIALYRAGTYPSSRRVAAYLGRRGYRRNDVVNAAWKTIMEQLRRGRAGRRLARNVGVRPRGDK